MRKAFLQLHFAVFLAGFTAILGRLIQLNEGLLVWWRMLLTIAGLLLLFVFTRRLERLPLRLVSRLFRVGALMALHWVFFYGSIKYSNVSIALVCFSAIGFFTSFMEPLILKRQIDWIEVFLGSLAIVAILLIVHFDPQYKIGIVLGIISSLLSSLFPIYSKRLLEEVSTGSLILYEHIGGWLFLTLLMPLYLFFLPAKSLYPASADWSWLLILSWVCTICLMYFSVSALRELSAFTVNLSFNLEPFYGILLAFLIFQENEQLSSGFYAGLGLIVLTVVLQSLRLYRKRYLLRRLDSI